MTNWGRAAHVYVACALLAVNLSSFERRPCRS
jgi:hypothetical protein